MEETYLFLSLARLWNPMAGDAGLDPVGQQAYVGFVSYMLIALTDFGGLHPVVAILAGGLLAAALSVPIATLVVIGGIGTLEGLIIGTLLFSCCASCWRTLVRATC